MESIYLKFEEVVRPNAKTKMFSVLNKAGNETLGLIAWKAHWRRYVFSPSKAEFDSECLKDIAKFLSKLMLDIKLEKQNAEQQKL